MQRHEIRVYYEDTDAAGIVYHARYLMFAERARTEYLRAVGFDHTSLRLDHNVVFAVHKCRLKFRRPARLDDHLVVVSSIGRISGARMTFEQKIMRQDLLLCDVCVELAVLNSEMRPRRLPQICVDAFHMLESSASQAKP